MTNINEYSQECTHASEAEAWAAFHADEQAHVGTDVLVSEMEVYDETIEANPYTVKFAPPRVGKVLYYDYRLLDDVGGWIIHPVVGLEVDGVEGWTDGAPRMWEEA